MSNLFKAYDIRGKFPDPLSPPFAFALGAAIANIFHPASCLIGIDARLSGPALRRALASSLASCGINVSSLSMCGTEEIYYALANCDFDMGIMITGSHNPADENGFKLVARGAIPIGADSGLRELEDETMRLIETTGGDGGCNKTDADPSFNIRDAGEADFLRERYLDWLVSYSGLDRPGSKKLRVVADAGNGSAGPVLACLADRLFHELIPQNWQPDGNFPNGVPNPLLPSKRSATARAVSENNADLGIAFDGDFDRCFFYDASGNFIDSYYLVGLLGVELLKKFPGAKIIHDGRVYWNTRELVLKAGGTPIMGKTGHAYMKEKMRVEDAVYGGEMSAHHYYRDFAYCDSGMLTMLLILGFLQNSQQILMEILRGRMDAYPCSGEINFISQNAPELLEMAKRRHMGGASHIDCLDGINLEMDAWRFNMRLSNTEPLLRLNVESRGSRQLMEDMTGEITDMLLAEGAKIAQ